MNRTSNYNLCQWEETDRVRRTDFNEDNAKIDQALAQERAAREAVNGRVTEVSERAGAKLLKSSAPLGQAAETYTISFAGIDWSQWKTVYLVLDMKGTTLVLGDSTSDTIGVYHGGRQTIVLYPMFSASSAASGFNPGGGVERPVVHLASKFSDLTELVLYNKNYTKPVVAGTYYQIWGEK